MQQVKRTNTKAYKEDLASLQCQIKTGLEILVTLGMHMGIICEKRAFQRGLNLLYSSTESKVSLKITISIGF